MDDFSIFVESNEDIGLIFPAYKDTGRFTDTFLRCVEDRIADFVRDPKTADADLRAEINRFKSSVDKSFSPKAINTATINKTKANIKAFRSEMEKVLDRYAKARDRMSFGGNLLRAIILKPKAYSKEIDYDSYEKNNRNIRNIDRALDWIEKVLIDLFNLIDQDLNILTIVGKVYAKKKIYESADVSVDEVKSVADLLSKCKTPQELLEWMNCIQYGWIDESGTICGTGEEDNSDHMWAEYKLQSPLQLIRSKVGVCWDQCELERAWFSKQQKLPFAVIYLEIDNDEDKPSHTFLIYQDPAKDEDSSKIVYWFEHSWGQERGIHKFSDIDQCLNTIIQKFRYSQGFMKSPLHIHNISTPKYGIKVIPYMEWAHKEWKVDIGDLCYDEIFSESTEITPNTRVAAYEESDYFKVLKSDLDKDFKPKGHKSLSEFTKMHITNELAKKFKDQGKLIKWMRDQNPKYDDDCFLWVDDDGDYVGAITYDTKYDKNHHKYLSGIDVAYKYTGYGLGKQLLEEAIKAGVNALNVQIDNEIALKMYKDRGFRVTEESQKEIDSGKSKTYEMVLDDNEQKPIVESGGSEEDLPPNMPGEGDETEETKEESIPKKTDKAESSKNGVRRKKLYMTFIEWAKEYNSKNTFGSVFDKDIFHNVYPFVPEEMRYFYRLANPILCVLSGDLTFFQVSELKKLNKENPDIKKMMIFAATPNDLRVFNTEDKRVYIGKESDGKIELGESIGDTFDLYLQKMINKGDILNGSTDEE